MTTKETYFIEREKKSQMLLKTLTPCYFRYGWRSRVHGTQCQALWAVLVVMLLLHKSTEQLKPLRPVVSPDPLHILFPNHPGYFQVKNGWSLEPSPASGDDLQGKGMTLFNFAKWTLVKGLGFPFSCFQPRISEIENVRIHQVLNIQRILRCFFFIKHIYMLLCWVDFLSFPQTVLCFCW